MPNRLVQAGARHPRRSAAVLLAAVAGVAVLAVAGMAIAKSFTLKVTQERARHEHAHQGVPR